MVTWRKRQPPEEGGTPEWEPLDWLDLLKKEMPFFPEYWHTRTQEEGREEWQQLSQKQAEIRPLREGETLRKLPFVERDVGVGAMQTPGEKLIGEWGMAIAALGWVPGAGGIKAAMRLQKAFAKVGKSSPKMVQSVLKKQAVEKLRQAREAAKATIPTPEIDVTQLSAGQLRKRLLIINPGQKIETLVDDLIKVIQPPKLQPEVVLGKKQVPKFSWENIKGTYNDFMRQTERFERQLLEVDNFEYNGKMWQTLYAPMNQAKNRYLIQQYALQNSIRTFMQRQGIKLNDMWKPISVRGVELNLSQRMGVFIHRLNPDNLNHLLHGNFKAVGDVPQRLQFIDDVIGTLTPEQKRFAQFLQTIAEKDGVLLQSMVKQIEGGKRQMKLVKDYFPLHLVNDPSFAISEELAGKDIMKFVQKWALSRVGKSFTKGRVRGAGQPVELDVLEVIRRHISGVEHYKAYAPVVRDLSRIMNNKKFKDALTLKYGREMWKTWDDWLKKSAGGDPVLMDDYAEKMWRGLRTNATLGALGLNAVTSLKQFPSFLAGMAEIGETNMIKGLFGYISNPKATTELIKKMSPQLRARVMEREIGEMALRGGVKRQLSGKPTLREWFMVLTTTMDKFVVNSMFRGAYDDIIRLGTKAGRTDFKALEKEAVAYAEAAIRRTQPWFDMKDVPSFWRAGEKVKPFVMFQNQLNQYLNYWRFDILGRRSAGKISNFEALKKSAEGLVVPALMIGWASRARVPETAGEMLQDIGATAFGMIPIFGQFMSSGLRGWGSDTGVITTEWAGRVVEAMQDANKEEWGKAIVKLGESAGFLAGVPVNQTRRILSAMAEAAEGNMVSLMDFIWGTWARKENEAKGTQKGALEWNK